MARKRGVKLPTGPRDAIVEIMAANLSDPAANRAVINSLTPELRQTLDLLAWNGFMRFPDLTALVQPWKIERTSEEVAADLHQLGGYGLAFMPSGTGYIISPAVVNLTPVALPAPVQPKTPPSFSSPDAVAPHTLDALVIALASYVMTHPVRLTVSSRWDQPLPQSGAAIAAVRTKLDLPGEADFVVQGPAEHGVRGLVNLFGIESPGLTASLALADAFGKPLTPGETVPLARRGPVRVDRSAKSLPAADAAPEGQSATYFGGADHLAAGIDLETYESRGAA